jgi:hypothetical protein
MALNAFQREVQALAKRLGLKGDAERQVYSRPEYQDLLRNFFGDIQLPAGVDPSQIISRDAGALTYRDAEGYTHRLERNLNGTSSDIGRVTETSTDRPAVLPVTKQIPGTENAIQQALGVLSGTFGGVANTGEGQFFGLPNPAVSGNQTQGFQGTGALGNLSPADKALLDQITKATLEQLDQQFTRQGGDLVAQLYSRGMNESTLANDAVTRLQQGQGLVRNQALSDAAGRELGIRQFLTDLSTKSALDLFNSITGNETTRGVASGQIGLGREELGQRRIDSDRQFQIEQQKLELQRQNQSPWKSILSAVATLGAAAIPGIGAFLGPAVGAATGGFGKAGRPPVGGDGGYG